MAAKEVDYSKLLGNVSEMINVLEYDGTRSAGKIKLNSETLVNLYNLKARYEAAILGAGDIVEKTVPVTKKPAVKTTTAKPTV